MQIDYVRYDNTRPDMMNYNATYSKQNDRIDYVFDATDDGIGGPITKEIKVDGITGWIAASSSGTISTVGWPEGTYTVRYRANDTIEYSEVTQNVSVIRNFSPSINLTQPATNQSFVEVVEIIDTRWLDSGCIFRTHPDTHSGSIRTIVQESICCFNVLKRLDRVVRKDGLY